MKAAEKAVLRASAKADFLEGMSYRQIAAKYAVGVGSVARWAEKDGWAKLERKREVYVPPELEMEQEIGTPEQAPEAPEAIEPKTDFDLLRLTAYKALKKINDLLDLDEALAPRDIKSITSSLLDLKGQLNALSPRELREQAARLRSLEKQAETEKQTADPVVIQFIDTEGTEI